MFISVFSSLNTSIWARLGLAETRTKARPKFPLSLIYLLVFAVGIISRKRLNADVIFLMDASTADSPRFFQSQKDLIKSIMRSLGNSADNFRASLVVYSFSSTVLADLNSYTTPQRFEEVVNRATYVRGVGCFVYQYLNITIN